MNDKYRTAAAVLGSGQIALHAALSAYNSGSLTAGFNNGYVEKVIAAKPSVSSIPLFEGQGIMPRAVVPSIVDRQHVQQEQEQPNEDSNSAPTRVICGHGPDTTVGFEQRMNPFVGAGAR